MPYKQDEGGNHGLHVEERNQIAVEGADDHARHAADEKSHQDSPQSDVPDLRTYWTKMAELIAPLSPMLKYHIPVKYALTRVIPMDRITSSEAPKRDVQDVPVKRPLTMVILKLISTLDQIDDDKYSQTERTRKRWDDLFTCVFSLGIMIDLPVRSCASILLKQVQAAVLP